MPVYQVPQFLDSGDKILGPLNARQFGYAMAGGVVVFLTYVIFSSMFPGLGLFAVAPAIPFAGLITFIAFGKYNGRDAEVYVLKFFLFMKKPKKFVFKRGVDTHELDMRLSKLNHDSIVAEWNKRIGKKNVAASDIRGQFDKKNVTSKIAQIKDISSSLDVTMNKTYNSINSRSRLNNARDRVLQKSQQSTNPYQSFRKTKSVEIKTKVQQRRDPRMESRSYRGY